MAVSLKDATLNLGSLHLLFRRRGGLGGTSPKKQRTQTGKFDDLLYTRGRVDDGETPSHAYEFFIGLDQNTNPS